MATGLRIAEMFFYECGMPMLEAEFAPWLGRIAAGLAGQGSECFGYDDRISLDHDFAPGFCLWIPEALRPAIGERLRRAYDALPVREFILRNRVEVGFAPGESLMTGAREHRVGVHSIEEFYTERTGLPDAPRTFEDWVRTPQMYLAEAVNGKVFRDPEGRFTAIRRAWQGFYPEDILKKKLAADCAMAGKTGQFNYARSLRRGDTRAAWWCCAEFITKATAALFLLNGRYMPYYKWRARAMEGFTAAGEAVPMLFDLAQLTEADSRRRLALIEDIAGAICRELAARGWSKAPGNYLLDHARQVMGTISDPGIAAMNIFVGEDA